jgi:hypothetical protein
MRQPAPRIGIVAHCTHFRLAPSRNFDCAAREFPLTFSKVHIWPPFEKDHSGTERVAAAIFSAGQQVGRDHEGNGGRGEDATVNRDWPE